MDIHVEQTHEHQRYDGVILVHRELAKHDDIKLVWYKR